MQKDLRNIQQDLDKYHYKLGQKISIDDFELKMKKKAEYLVVSDLQN